MLKRKKRTLSLPSSVSLEDAEKYWEALSFGNTKSSEPKAFNPDSFALAQESVEKYRRLARAGRIEMMKKEELLAGQPKIVYGQGIYKPKFSPFFPEPSTEESQKTYTEPPKEQSTETLEEPVAEKSQEPFVERPIEESVETKQSSD